MGRRSLRVGGNSSSSESEVSSLVDTTAPTSTFTQKITGLLADYTTVQRVVVRSPRLRIPELIMFGAVLIINIMYVQIYTLKCFAREDVLPSPLLSIVPPLVSSHCEERFVDCVQQHVDVGDLETYPYCVGNKTMNVSGCTPYFARYLRGAQTQFIPTRSTRILQERDGVRKPWHSTNISRLYVAGAEHTVVELTHGFRGRGWNRSEMVGILKSKNGSECQFPCKDCNLPNLVPSCNVSGLEQTGWADYIPLQVILDAAELNLNELAQHTVHLAPLRYWGVGLVFGLMYSDDDPVDFWFRGQIARPIPKFVIQPHRLFDDGFNQYYDVKEPPWVDSFKKPKHREILKQHGILVLDSSRGQRIDFGLSYLVMSIVVSLGALRVAKLIVDSFLVRLYSFCPGWELTYMLYQHTTHRHTPDESCMQRIFSEDADPDRRAKLFREAHDKAHENSLQESFGGRELLSNFNY